MNMSRLLLQPQSPESIMRSVAFYSPRSVSELEEAGIIKGPNLERHPLDLPAPSALPRPVYSGPEDLTASQQLALLMLSRSELARECVRKLKKSTVRAGYLDFEVLVDRRWAIRQPTAVYHTITPMGMTAVNRLALKVAKDLGVHFFIKGGSRYQTSVRCTCGNFTYHHNRNEGHERSAFARRMGEHLAEVGQTKATVIAGA